MKHTRVSSYVPPPYAKNSPSMKTRNELAKKNSISGESSKTGKLAQADMNVRTHLQNGEIEKKYTPLTLDRKNEFTSNLYQLAKGTDKDKQTYSKLYKTKETQQKKVVQKTSRPLSGQPSEKLSIYQYVQSKSKRPEDQKVALNISNQVSSRISSRIVIPEDHNESILQKINETNSLSTKRYLAGTPHDTSQSKISKPKLTPGHHKTASTVIRGVQKTPSTNGTKQLNIFQPSTNNLSFHEIVHDYSKTPVPRSGDTGKAVHANAANNFNDALAQKLKLALQGLQGDLHAAKHRRGLSTGQVPMFIDQQALQERAEKMEKMEKMEKVEKVEKVKEVEKVKPIELAPADPQQEQDEYYEKFFHSDKMTFDFEKQIISQRHKMMQQNISCTASATPTNKKPATAAAHTRTRSIEDPNSLLPTKASSRWNTKRSSVGDEVPAVGRERTDFEKEELRKYLRG